MTLGQTSFPERVRVLVEIVGEVLHAQGAQCEDVEALGLFLLLHAASLRGKSTEEILETVQGAMSKFCEFMAGAAAASGAEEGMLS